MNDNGTPDQAIQKIIEQASRKETSPFDYLIVGAGAGGGPLACRLALSKKKVLLIEAGPDPAVVGDIHDAPLFHAASTEHPDLSWSFSVRHFENTERQQEDQKYDASHDTDSTGGIFYPRASGLGGCTSHHAMIVIRPNDSDWEDIADLTNDDSWRAKNMQPYFAKFENCLYLEEYRGFLSNLLGWITKAWFWILGFVNPKLFLDTGGHGDKGWQPTSFIAPKLIEKIIKTDQEFTTVLIQSAFKVIKGNKSLTALLKRYLITLGFIRAFDPNDLSTRASSPNGGVFLIPTGIGGKNITDEKGKSMMGRRAGVREFILRTQRERPNHLFIAKGFHVTRLILEEDRDLKIPRAIGVEAVRGAYLYKASPKYQPAGDKPATLQFFVRHKPHTDSKEGSILRPTGEVVLSGGSFKTPQILMLSGIGDNEHVQKINAGAPTGKKIEFRVHLRGVGRNLQDRYEISVLSKLKTPFVSLETVAFDPANAGDKVLAEWVKHKTGLYGTNGGTIAVLHRTEYADEDKPEPDLFTFGAPAAFRGYYWGWSKELLRIVKGAAADQRDLWSWVVLKGYTRNNAGSVRLRSTNPFDTPVICFRSFDDGAPPGWEKDVKALATGVERMREINKAVGPAFEQEIQPELYIAEKNKDRATRNLPPWTLEDWIKNEAWGHHACGTCRLGSDSWTADTAKLTDKEAVIDSRFRVHGVAGLRIVDASIFPKIPGYFILAPIFMVSEHAAATFLRDNWEENYPSEIRAIEEEALRKRRARAWVDERNQLIPAEKRRILDPFNSADSKASDLDADPVDIQNKVGLALSGGGIRSATFSLGVLQALAAKDRLRHIDYLSTISGGGFTGSFLGRLFTRKRVAGAPDPCGRAQDVLTDDKSGPMRWVRTQANYLFEAGANDELVALGVFFRNLFTVHLVVGALLFTLFALLIAVSRASLYQQIVPLPELPYHLPISSWWWVPVAVAGVAILPMMLGVWLAPKALSSRSYSPYPFAAWLIVSAGAAAGLTSPGGVMWAVPMLVTLALAWLWQEGARHGLADSNDHDAGLDGNAIRNRLSRGLGEAIVIFLAMAGWVVLDTLAGALADPRQAPNIIAGLMALAPLLQILRVVTGKALQTKGGVDRSYLLKAVGVILAIALLFLTDYLAHCLFLVGSGQLHATVIAITFLFSLTIGQAFDFLNASSFHAYYAAHITRTFLGASNEARTTETDVVAANVQTTLKDDDLPHFQYRPEENGGPLHLISVCVNETVDHASQREIRERKGLLMTVGSFGVSVGRRYFAKWAAPLSHRPWWMRLRQWIEGTNNPDTSPPALEALRLNASPNTFHPLSRRDNNPAIVKTLTLGEWAAVSGAAFSTGRGRTTSVLISLLAGLLNLRLGYWWDSGIFADERPGRFPGNLWVRLKGIPAAVFRMQSLLFSEWRGRFHGPSHELWNLTDGGEQDDSGLYELIRRRLPLIIAVDAGLDSDYTYGDLGNLERLVRLDFGVEFEWQTHPRESEVPKFVSDWIDLAQVSPMNGIKGNPSKGGPGDGHTALARIKYGDCAGQPDCWLLLIKPSLSEGESLDINQYAARHRDFPQDTTVDQFYDDEQWESYRKLAASAAAAVIRKAS